MKTTRNTSSGKRTIIAPSGIVLFIMILFWILGGQKSFAQGVGISESLIIPDPSSILELKWTSGPYKGFLAPRMTTANRLAILLPAQGLLVYDTNTKSFWYYDGGWKAVMGAGSLGSPNQLLGMDASGTVNEYKTLNGSINILVTHSTGNINLTTSQDIHPAASPTFIGLTVSGLVPNSGVYTNGTSSLTSTPPATGILGYWSRLGGILSPTTITDWVTTSGNIYTTGSGTITSAGLLTGSLGATVSGGAVNLNNNSNFVTNINTGSSTGAVTIGNPANTITLPAFALPGVVHNALGGLLSSSLIINSDITPGSIDLTSKVTNVLPIANGGTNSSTTLNNDRFMISNAGKIIEAGVMTDGQVIVGKLNSAPQVVTLGNDATINNTGSLTLANTAVIPGSYGDGTHVGNFTVDSKGRLIFAGNTLISGTLPGGLAGGDLSGTYPNPTVARINGVGLGTTTAIDKNILIANGTLWNSEPVSGDITISNTGITTISAGAIDNSKVSATAGIVDTKLATIATAGKVANSATTATALNTPSTIVLRDGSGNFAAGTITASLSGNATTATTATIAGSFSGSLAGDVTGTQGATVVSTVGTSTAAKVHTAELLTNTATSVNKVDSIVKRDGSGNFAAGIITASLSGNAATATLATTATNLASGAGGTIPYQSASGTTLMTAVGTSGQVLTSGGAGAPTWTTPTTGTVTSVTGTAPIVSSGGNTPAISMAAATSLVPGYLTSADWSTFNGKQNLLTNSAGLTAALSDETGTGLAVFGTSPILITPTIGAATATSVNKVTITAPATSSTLTIADGQTLTVSGSATVSGGSHSGTNTGDNAVNTLYSGLVTNATHTGDVTGATALTVVGINGTSLSGLVTGILKNTTGTGIPSIAIAGDFPTLNQSTTGTANIAGGTVGAIPYQTALNATGVLAATSTANKVLMSGSDAAPVWSTPTFPNASAPSRKMIVSDGTNWIASTETYAVPGASGNLLVSNGTNWISALPTFNQNTTGTAANVSGIVASANGGTGVNNGANTITLGGNLTTAGAFATTLSVAGATNVSLPASGTLATLAGNEALTNKTINGNTVTTGTGTLTIAAGKTLTASNDAMVSGTNTGDNTVNTLYSGLVTNATHTGDATGATALTVVGINGTLLTGLATGILKNTTGTGVPSIAVASDFPILNQNTTGNAATATSATTATHLGDGLQGSIPYQTAANTTTMLPKGTAGQVLAMNGGATAPQWQNAGAGDMILAAVQTVSGAKTFLSDVTIDATGSSSGAPRTVGIIPMPTGTFARFAFGDDHNVLQNGYGQRMQLTAYWGIEIAGHTEYGLARNFVTGVGADPSLSVIGSITTAPVLAVTAAVSQTGNLQEWRNSGGTSLSSVSSSGSINLKVGAAAAGGAPLKFTSGTNLTAAEAGAVEYDGTNFTVTNSTAVRYTLAKTLTATGALDFPSTAAQNSNDLIITVTGAALGDAVVLGIPNGSILTNSTFTAWVSSADNVTVRFNNYSAGLRDPVSGTFRVSVLKY